MRDVNKIPAQLPTHPTVSERFESLRLIFTE